MTVKGEKIMSECELHRTDQCNAFEHSALLAKLKLAKDALEWISVACGNPTIDKCPHCRRPNGLPALVAHAENTLAKLKQ